MIEPNFNNSTLATDDRSILGGTSQLPFPNPFVGLRPFRTEESLLFFGRHEQTVELLQQLHKTRFLAVVGSSGCGKSSLIRAGLIPKLKAGFLIEDRDRWLTATMKPGDSPLRNLAAALLEAAFGDSTEATIDEFVKAIRQSGVETIIKRLAPALRDSSANLLLLIDQFEEIFRFGVESNKPDQREEAEDFVSLMLALAAQRNLPIYVVMTMRSDFIGDCDNFYGLPEAMNRSQYLVPRLTRQQRQQAIEGPIRLFGASISPRLLDRVLNDVGDKSDQLPVMQHALMRTFEVWQTSGDAEVDAKHYESVGTLTEALSRDAEAALTELSEEYQKITELMFQALTDTDARNRQIRRRAHMSELCAVTRANHKTIETIIEQFSGSGRSFLTITKEVDPLIDISHESLIRQWKRMADWVKTEADWRDRYKRLSHAAEIFFLSKKYDDLLKGSQLTLALEWQDKRRPNHIWAIRYHPNTGPTECKRLFDFAITYLKTSERIYLSEIKEERKEKERRERIIQWRKQSAIMFIICFIFFALAAIIIDKTYRQNIYKTDISTADEEYNNGHYDKAMDLLTRYDADRLMFFQIDVRDDQWNKLWKQMHNELKTLKGHQEPVNSIHFSPNGRMLASASDDRTIKLWDIQAGQAIATLDGHEGPVLSISFDPSGKLLASASADQTVKLWDIQTRQIVATLNGHQASVLSVAFAADGKMLASASMDKTIKLWDVQSGQDIATLDGHKSDVYSIAFSPDGKILASASLDQTVKLWDLQTGKIIITFSGHLSSVLSVAFAPDGKTLASTSYDKTIKLWDAQLGQTIATLDGHEKPVLSVAFAPDGRTLASASEDKTVRLWDAQSGQYIALRNGHSDTVKSVAFAPDGKTLASAGGNTFGSKDYAIRLWRAATDEEVARQRNK